jgi:predicted MFS family arabinose efflux permease
MSETAGPSDLPRDRWYALFLLTVVYTINIADRFVVSTLIEPIKAEFHLTDAQVGWLTGAALAIFYVAAGIPLGVLADRTSRKRMVAVALAAWSVITILSGFTRTFWQLLIARIGVGVGEAGGTPPSQSLLADKFPPAARGFAMSLYAVGAAAGAALGSSLGGYLTDAYGWRTVLIVFGALGLPPAMVVALTLRESRRGALDDAPPPQVSTLRETLAFTRRQRSLMHILAGTAVITYWGWGLLWWTPTFLARSHGMSLSSSGAQLGLMHIVGGVGVTLGTAAAMAWLRDRAAANQAKFIAAATLIQTIPSITAFAVNSSTAALLALWVFIPLVYLYIGPTLALAQNLVPATMRSQIVAILLFVANVANLVLAPVVIGALSDWLSLHIAHPEQSLRFVLVGTGFMGIWAAWHYWAAARHLRSDLERAGTA